MKTSNSQVSSAKVATKFRGLTMAVANAESSKRFRLLLISEGGGYPCFRPRSTVSSLAGNSRSLKAERDRELKRPDMRMISM